MRSSLRDYENDVNHCDDKTNRNNVGVVDNGNDDQGTKSATYNIGTHTYERSSEWELNIFYIYPSTESTLYIYSSTLIELWIGRTNCYHIGGKRE